MLVKTKGIKLNKPRADPCSRFNEKPPGTPPFLVGVPDGWICNCLSCTG